MGQVHQYLNIILFLKILFFLKFAVKLWENVQLSKIDITFKCWWISSKCVLYGIYGLVETDHIGAMVQKLFFPSKTHREKSTYDSIEGCFNRILCFQNMGGGCEGVCVSLQTSNPKQSIHKIHFIRQMYQSPSLKHLTISKTKEQLLTQHV